MTTQMFDAKHLHLNVQLQWTCHISVYNCLTQDRSRKYQCLGYVRCKNGQICVEFGDILLGATLKKCGPYYLREKVVGAWVALCNILPLRHLTPPHDILSLLLFMGTPMS